MKEEILFITLIIQFIVQIGLYLGTNILFNPFIKSITKSLSMGHKLIGTDRQTMANSVTGIQLLIYNLMLSTIVLKFTNTGTISGITNLGASIFVGLIMFWQYSKYGKYYIKVEEKKAIWKRAKQLINKIKKGEK